MTPHPRSAPTDLAVSASAAAVVLTTYRKPAWLELALLAFAEQDVGEFRVIVADDGSGRDTAAAIERLRPRFGERLLHVWHEDIGFRKCEILNRAILASHAEYLIFTDGDCLPRRDFVRAHLRLAERGRYLSGGVVWLPASITETIAPGDVVSGNVTDPAWLTEHGWRGGRRRLRLVRSPRLAALLDALTPTGATFNGHNSSVWRDALLAVNGFDAEMGYGGLDRALGERLDNLGLRGKQVRHRAVTAHLHHDRPWRDPEVVRKNREIRARIRQSGEMRARRGISELSP